MISPLKRLTGERETVFALGLTEGVCAGLVAYKMTSTTSRPGTMGMSMRTTMLTSGRMISPFAGPEVVWDGLNARVGLGQGKVSVSEGTWGFC